MSALRLGVVALGILLLFASVPAVGAVPEVRIEAPLGNSLVDVQTTLALPRATWYNDADGDKVFDDLERRFVGSPLASLSVIVTFRDGTDLDEALRAAQRVSGNFEPSFVYPKLFGVAATLRTDQVEAIARLADVRQVEWDTPGTPELDTATANFGVRAVQEQLATTGDLDGQPAQFSKKDVVVAILDTGFDGKHVDLAGKFLAFVDSKDKKVKDPYDTAAHGTHVASIVGGLGVGQAKYRGVAPGAGLVGIQITGSAPYGGATSSKAGALFGVDWILQNQATYNIRVSTISFGFGVTNDGTDALELAFDRAFAAGILPFKSNGNSGPEKGTTTVPGGARGIVSVGSMLDPGAVESTAPGSPVPTPVAGDGFGFHLSGYSSRGPTKDLRIKPDIAAPGQSIMAASNGTTDKYVAFSGTSMASPFAAGSAALVMAADPSLNASQVRGILFATAEDWGAPGPDVDYGHGRLNTMRAVQSAILGRLQREGAPYAELERVAALAGPDVPFHAFGKLTGNFASKTMTVKDAKKPVAVTFLLNASVALPASTPVGNQARPWVVEIRSSSDAVIGRIAAPTSARQQLITFVPPAAGAYQVNAYHPGMGWEVVYDVSAGLPPPPVLDIPILPEPAKYAEHVAKVRALEGQAKSSGDAPAFESALAIVVLALGVLVARRRYG
ncbi:MAG: S8 family serine peptidase [Euryarchaeota archaeon]|nr:S8 family serine peptidase [Euryarchaeota archaeon]